MKKRVMNRMKKFRKITEKIVLFIAVIVFCYAAFNLFTIYKANFNEKKETEKLRDLAKVPKKEKDLDAFKVDFEKLKSINPNVVGWIVVKDTAISYPIVQGKDNEYYLTHTFEKKENYAGSIFMDASASSDFSDMNTFIYGHNVYHGTMFAELQNYMKESFFNEHPFIYLYTPNGNFKLQVFSAYVAKADDLQSYRMAYNSIDDFSTYLNTVSAKSKYTTNVGVTGTDKIITLYTCSYENGQTPGSDSTYIEDRYYIHAKMIQELK